MCVCRSICCVDLFRRVYVALATDGKIKMLRCQNAMAFGCLVSYRVPSVA